MQTGGDEIKLTGGMLDHDTSAAWWAANYIKDMLAAEAIIALTEDQLQEIEEMQVAKRNYYHS